MHARSLCREESNRGSEDCGTRAPRFHSHSPGSVVCGANLMEDDRIDNCPWLVSLDHLRTANCGRTKLTVSCQPTNQTPSQHQALRRHARGLLNKFLTSSDAS